MWTHADWMMGHDWGMWWFMPFGGFWFLILVAVLLAVLFARTPRYPAPPPRSAALDLLEQRYAKGEIGRDEYIEKKRDLTGAA